MTHRATISFVLSAILRGSTGLGWLMIFLAIGLGGCATVNFDYPKSESTVFEDTDDSLLGRHAAPRAAAHPPGESGFILQVDGVDALATRILLARWAEHSIDAQYYLITADVIGYLFIEALLDAADRGVRVRFLLDDIMISGYDLGLAALDSHPNIELCIFNPIARGGWRTWNLLTDFSRINRRMHNKTFTVDNQFTIIGGRNIAAEYFGAQQDVNFGDADFLAIGSVVKDVSRQFDTYWNDQLAVPIPAFIDLPEDPEETLKALRGRIATAIKGFEETRYTNALTRSIFEIIEIEGSDYTWAPYQLVYDSPKKTRNKELKPDESIIPPLVAAVEAAKKELIIVSPYFVPTKKSIDGLGDLVDRGVDVMVITNSLASNNHAVVHSGYAPTRKPLIQRGVRIYEVRPDAGVVSAKETGATSAASNLHTKAFIVDREVMFLGSFNWDPRSVYINTELGVIIESPVIAGTAANRIDEKLPTATYQVIVNENGCLRWITQDDSQKTVYKKEPETSFWKRFTTGFMGILPLDSQL